MKSDFIKKESVDGCDLKLQQSEAGKWIVTRKGCVIGFISLLPLPTTKKRYLLELECNGCTLVEDFDTLDDAWNKVKGYISYFKL